jgi:heat shock protein HtpX
MQNLKTVVLLAAISGLLIAVGGAVGGLSGLIMFGAFALIMNIGSYWFSANIILRMSRAHEIDQASDPRLFRLIEDTARRANMPMPRVYVIDSPQPNAFATGRNPKHAAVAVTTGIRELLDERELRGVLGHEMAHVKNRDILTSSIADGGNDDPARHQPRAGVPGGRGWCTHRRRSAGPRFGAGQA